MRRLIVAVVLLFTVACGNNSPMAASGAILYTLDANSCRGLPALTIDFYVDGTNVGSGTLTPGQSSRSFSVAAGQHVLSARVANINYVWPVLNATANPGGSFTYVLICT